MANKNISVTPGVDIRTLHDAITATATSNPVACVGAAAIGVFLNQTAAGAGGTLTVQVSLDNGETYIDYNMLVSNVTNTNAQNLTRVASIATSGVGKVIAWFDLATLGAITHFKATLTVTAGTFTVTSAVRA